MVLCFSLILQSTNVYAENKIPDAFWQLIKDEAVLVDSSNLQDQIDNWLDIISLFDTWPANNQKRLEITTPRLQKIIANYEALKNYDQALVYLEAYIENATYLEDLGLWNQDARLWAESKIINLKVDIDLFVTTEVKDSKAPLAKYEPKNGLYYGATYDLDPNVKSLDQVGHVPAYPKENSAFLIYLDFGQNIRDFDWYISQAKAAGSGVLLAWNAYEVYGDMAQHSAYIQSTAQYLSDLDVPVFLRYGGEFNIAEGFEDHQGFIDNYQYLADLVRREASNVAMVWSPNEISASDRDHEDYYPGDTYVDWVGISTYTSYYFGIKKDYGAQQAAIDNQYFTGSKANPLSKIDDIVSTYGHKKPIMITENGIGHYSKIAEEDLTDWAKIQLQRTYAYIPLKYPQVKAIFYFNAHVKANTRNIYALYENKVIQEAFVDLTASDVYLDKMDKSLSHYPYSVNSQRQWVTDETLHLQTLLIVPELLRPSVRYMVNNEGVFRSSTLPYHFNLKASDLKEGLNSLDIEILDDQQVPVKTVKYSLFKTEEGVSISKAKQLVFRLNHGRVYENNLGVDLPAPPFIKDGRSMVPLRYIGEALGAKVTWYADSKSVTYEKQGQVMTLSLNDTTAYMNGEKVILDVAPTLLSGSTFVPIRVISEYFGAKVTWRGADESIIIDIF